jgi:hypothetical protein
VGREGPRHKGVGVLAIVEGLKATPQAQRHLPESLKHYLEDAILPSAWYPERDYNVLIEALALGVGRRVRGSDVWHHFGRLAAQRDIAGDQDEIPERNRVKTAGVYRNFRDNDPHDVAGMFQRVERLWRLYHDSGRLSVARAADDTCSVLVRIVDFHFPLRGLVDVQTGYIVEYAHLLGLQVEATLLRSVTDGHLFCEWRCSVERSAQHAAALAALPCAAPHP